MSMENALVYLKDFTNENYFNPIDIFAKALAIKEVTPKLLKSLEQCYKKNK
jgi:hypothetical protein